MKTIKLKSFLKVSFLVTVKSNYRSVAYHNWSHGFHVCNSIYSILKASPGIFTPVEVLLNILPQRLESNKTVTKESWPVGGGNMP